MQTRDRLYQLIDELPESDLAAVERILTERRFDDGEDTSTLADAPWDDEPETPEEAEAVAEARAEFAAGRVVSHDEARRRLLGRP